MAAHLGTTPRQIRLARTAAQPALSLDTPAHAAGDLAWSDILSDGRTDVTGGLEASELTEHVELALDALPPGWRRVLRLRFGLDGRGEQSPNEINAALGISRDRVYHIQARSLRRLRDQASLRRYLVA